MHERGIGERLLEYVSGKLKNQGYCFKEEALEYYLNCVMRLLFNVWRAGQL